MNPGLQAARHLLASALLLGLVSAALAKPPNIILILTDDQGWNNTEVPMIPSRADTRSDYYLTPNFKRLADSGMTFSQAYAPHPVCSPSRHSIQFGMTPAKLKKTSNRAVNYPEPFPVRSIPRTERRTSASGICTAIPPSWATTPPTAAPATTLRGS